jgi:hypothetical protein
MYSPMKLQPEMSSAQFAARIGPQELGHIITLRKNLDHMAVLARFAEQYRKLGWSLAALAAHTGADLGIDFTLPQKAWAKRLMDVSLKGLEVNLAVRTNSSSRLFAVKIEGDKGRTKLDRFGIWQSCCVAQAGSNREQHFFVLPTTWHLPSFSFPDQGNPDIEVLGEGGAALAPPALEPYSEETWRWLHAPWETPPCPPPAGLCQFLKKYGLISSVSFAREPHLPSWREVFARISPHKDLLSALLASQVSRTRYYQEIIKEALKAGLREPEILKAVLWHAPHGDAQRHPERWRHLLKVVAELAKTHPGLEASPAVRTFNPSAEPSPLSGSLNLPTQGMKQPEQETTSRKSLIDQLERLTARTRELERQLAALQRTPNLSSSQASGNASQNIQDKNGAIPFWEDWLALIQRPSLEARELEAFRAAVGHFLKENRDLATDDGKIQLVLYCYTNYIKINPNYTGLPHQERLNRAGEIARSFLKSPGF